jgi:DNA mismatch repair protein MutS2
MTQADPTVFSAATAEALEFPTLLAVLAELAATDLGRERLLAARPLSDPEAFGRQRRRFEEAQSLVAERRLVGDLGGPLADVLAELRSGRPASPGPALVRLGDLLRATGEARDRLLAAEPPAPELARLAGELPDLAPLARRIGKALDRRGEVREDASPHLASLRGRIRKLRDGLYSELKRLVEAERESLAEETIPFRGGRLVLLLDAGARGRVPGLLHGRSASGRSFYFEPLAVVEGNNNLQQAVEDEEAERNRILGELLTEAQRLGPDLAAHAAFLAELDFLQAAARFAQSCGGRLAEVAPEGELTLSRARHPLLEPALAGLRARALGAGGHQGPVVPLDLELTADRRILVVTGPNAGGKTVALKTVGLAALLAQCALPVPAGPGTRLPRLARLVATVGDEQDLLADRSTFSGRLLRLKEAWEAAAPDGLLLIDELGSGTDPEEGAALSAALLEGLAARGTLAVLTTHLTPLAAAALELPGAGCAAMELDPATGTPTYHLVPGPPGGSEALALARRLGLPGEWLDRAEARLSSEHRQMRRLLAELERLRGELAGERERLAREADEAALLRARLAREQAALEAERLVVGRRLKAELEAFRAATRERLSEELARLKDELAAGRRKGLEAAAVERLFAAAPELLPPELPAALPPAVGGPVRHRRLGWEGVLDRLDGSKAEVLVRGKRVRATAAELEGLAPGGAASAPFRPATDRHQPEPEADGHDAPAELILIGQRVEPALDALDAYLDRALLGGRQDVRVVHGHGSGRLRQAVRQHLKSHPAVAAIRAGAPNEGGNGATIATLRSG